MLCPRDDLLHEHTAPAVFPLPHSSVGRCTMQPFRSSGPVLLPSPAAALRPQHTRRVGIAVTRGSPG